MSILGRLLAPLVRKEMARAINMRDAAGWTGGHESPSGEVVNSSSVLSLSAAWACVNLIAGTIASLPLMVYRTDARGSRTIARDHPLYRLLHDSPNNLQTSLDFWEFMCSSVELWGNAYARKVRSGSRVVSLIPIMPDAPVVDRLSNGLLRYKWTEGGQTFEETSDTILHVRGFGGNPLGGMSTLSFGAKTFGLAQAIERAAGSTFKNGMRPSVAITFPDWLTKENRDMIHEKLLEKYAGAMNAGRPFVAEGGQKIEVVSMKPEDAQMLQSRAMSVEEACRFFGVPPFMIGHTEKTTSWGRGIEQQTLGFQKFTLRRRLKRIESSLDKQLLTPADRAQGITIEFNIEGLLRADSSGRSQFYREMTQIGAMTINEVRALENLPPVEGGDVPRMQSQNVPITQAPAPAQLPPA